MKWLALVLLAVPGLAFAGSAGDNTSHFAPFDGVKVHYESYGAGKEAVVFIHGWTCDLTFWRGQAPVYRNRRSLLIDLPGHGQSDKPNVAYPMEFFARSIEAVLHDAGVERAVLVGHSLGGPIAYSFIRLFPEQAKALVLVDEHDWSAALAASGDVFEPGRATVHIPIHGGSENTDVTGAGDTVIATFTLSLAAGADFASAARR